MSVGGFFLELLDGQSRFHALGIAGFHGHIHGDVERSDTLGSVDSGNPLGGDAHGLQLGGASGCKCFRPLVTHGPARRAEDHQWRHGEEGIKVVRKIPVKLPACTQPLHARKIHPKRTADLLNQRIDVVLRDFLPASLDGAGHRPRSEASDSASQLVDGTAQGFLKEG